MKKNALKTRRIYFFAPAQLESRIRDLEGRLSMLQSQLSAQNAMLRILMQDYEERKRHQQ
jgi:hypothetical protein